MLHIHVVMAVHVMTVVCKRKAYDNVNHDLCNYADQAKQLLMKH